LESGLYYVVYNMEHPCLSLMEMEGLIGGDKIHGVYSGVALLDGVDSDTLRKAVKISSCLKEAGVVLSISDALEWRGALPQMPACKDLKVAFRRIGGVGRHVSKREVIAHLKIALGLTKVEEVKKPEVGPASCCLSVIFVEGFVIYGAPLAYQGKSKLLSINPHDLPYYSPGALNPWFARLLSNSAGEVGGVLMDPFCGTGAIPVWAKGDFQAAVCGDISGVRCRGALANYAYVHGFDAKIHVVRWDFSHLPIRESSIDAIITDLPYGRSVRSEVLPERGLVERFFETYANYLKRGGVAVASASQDLLPDLEMVTGAVERRCLMFVHNKLTRAIVKLVKR